MPFVKYMTKDSLTQFYSANADALAAEMCRLKRRNRLFVAAELATFALAIAMIVAFTVWSGSLWLYGAAVAFVLYIVVRRLDTLNGRRIDDAQRRHTVYANELKYLSGDYSAFDAGERYADADHAYTYDMDIFGHHSLYQRINRTVTSGGSDYLASCLARRQNDHRHNTVAFINARREALKKLAALEPLRTTFISFTGESGLNTQAVKAMIEVTRTLTLPAWTTCPLSLAVAVVLIVAFVVTVFLSLFTSLPGNVPLMWGTLQCILVFMLCSSPLRKVGKAVNSLHRQLKTYASLVRLSASAEMRSIDDPALGNLSAADASRAIQAFSELDNLLDLLDRRGNWIVLLLYDTFALSDFFLVRRFIRWQRGHASEIERWVDRVSIVDALVSMATYRYNEPTATDATIVAEDRVVYEADGLCHPFFGSAAVGNDFTIVDRNYYIITGANMAGKSTFLRSLGVNYVLAVCGMPVCASHMRVSLFNIFSSMRTNDNLDQGISYFNAELRRLSQLLDSCRNEGRTLIILDEILRGTNSLDKLNGSRMFLNAVAEMDVTGVIATHDLELSHMADERPDRFRNHCFEITLDEEITYTYKISQGVARNQNATHLLKSILQS